MSDDKPKNAIDMPFQASSDVCVMVRPTRAEHCTLRLLDVIRYSSLLFGVSQNRGELVP